MTGEDRGARAGTMARRYWPFLAIVALQLLLLTLTPSTKTVSTQVQGTAGSGASTGAASDGAAGDGAAGDQGATTVDTVTGAAATSVATGSSGASTAATVRSGKAAGGTGTGTGTAAAGSGATAASGTAAASSASAAGQQVDGLGRPLTGDKSKCAPGGQLQENITFSSQPCIPAFTGNNGGPTYPGVTGDTITLVMYWPQYAEATQKALVAAGLAATPDQAQEATDTFAAFINKHYEMYGRKIKVVNFFSPAVDPPSLRADAKAIQARYHPFAVSYYAPGIMPEPLVDQFAQLGIITQGVGPLSDAWFKNHAPYAWGKEPQGSRAADMLADYYCKKMVGKSAALAGDPTMRVKKRKLGILTTDNPAYADVAQRLKTQVSGGMCGSAADGTTIYTYSSDATEAQNQRPTLVTRLKNDGITTETNVAAFIGNADNDKQQYYPENLLSGVGNYDDDLVGQFFSATVSSPSQMQNTFGIGWYPQASPTQEHEFYKVAHDINPKYDPAYLTQGPWDGLSFLAHLIQWAGPNLTPPNVEKGARDSEQIQGYANPKPFAGWKGQNPFAPMWKLAPAGIYTAWADAREIYWSSSAVSPSNGNPGAWVCVNSCKRFEVGGWQPSEPKA